MRKFVLLEYVLCSMQIFPGSVLSCLLKEKNRNNLVLQTLINFVYDSGIGQQSGPKCLQRAVSGIGSRKQWWPQKGSGV